MGISVAVRDKRITQQAQRQQTKLIYNLLYTVYGSSSSNFFKLLYNLNLLSYKDVS